MSTRIPAKFDIIFCIHCCMGYQNEDTVKQERCEVEFVNKTTGEVYSNTYHLNRTRMALNLIIMFKKPEEDMKVLTSGYMWITNLYKLIAIQFEMKLISVISYRIFDNLFHNYSTPAMKNFPLPNVKYVFKGWIPNSKKFAHGIRSGKYKIHVILCNANKDVNYMSGNWYFSAEDIIRY